MASGRQLGAVEETRLALRLLEAKELGNAKRTQASIRASFVESTFGKVCRHLWLPGIWVFDLIKDLW